MAPEHLTAQASIDIPAALKRGASAAGLRVNRGLTADLQRALKARRTTVTRWLHGESEPSLSVWLRLSSISGLSLDELVLGTQRPAARTGDAHGIDAPPALTVHVYLHGGPQ